MDVYSHMVQLDAVLLMQISMSCLFYILFFIFRLSYLETLCTHKFKWKQSLKYFGLYFVPLYPITQVLDLHLLKNLINAIQLYNMFRYCSVVLNNKSSCWALFFYFVLFFSVLILNKDTRVVMIKSGGQ